MHSYHFTDPDSGQKVHIHHNGDYSGHAIINTEADGVPVEFAIPCAALVEFSGEAVRDKIVCAIEELDL